MNTKDFASLPLSDDCLANLASLDYLEMTPIQAASLPAALEGRDLIAQAKTGSGKTAAFGLGVLHALNPRWFAVQGLVMCPTRELADQVAKELRRLARYMDNIKVLTLCGGVPMGPQIGSLEHGAHIVVGTPGRIRDHLGKGTLDLSTVKILVLDEADRMVDMGFYDDIENIARACPKRRQTLLFSATYPDSIKRLAAPLLIRPVEIRVESLHNPDKIEQRFYKVDAGRRNETVADLLLHLRPTSTLAFCNTKIHCRELADALRERGISVLALYGDLEQRDRDEILLQFANRSCSVLVATDVAARGLDIKELDLVLNVDVSRDQEIHVHRIGRTGRGEQKGLAVTLAADADLKWVKLIESYQENKVVWRDTSEFAPAPDARLVPPMITLNINAGRKEKLRPGDILGALTGDGGLKAEEVGKINVFDFASYVAIDRRVAPRVIGRLAGKIKGKNVKMRLID
ncbi:ATP-dependent RNA helicase DbpA [Paludibacterium paludis]|uniref:ATP-dependent RNA helicase n=1 Tax=Paludibacterium paludis TaxID=1225769 RepID=A0A918NYP6_9NEIS|nr:ATP-dependent RNA helicase DbpA [Paludibacterium paludis]GGY06458.1 ATP-dependent RNA helicase [Paludibacterium paludis]